MTTFLAHLIATILSFGGAFTPATPSFGAAPILQVTQGGTGAGTFTQGWIYSSGATSSLAASTSPTVNYIVATSTTKSIFPAASTTHLSAATSLFVPMANAILSSDANKLVVATTSIGVNYLTGTLPINKGGTNATSQTTNGVNYYDGSKITSGSSFTWDATILTLPNLITQQPGQGSTALLNNVLYGEDGYSFVASTTAGTSFSLTGDQFCKLTSLYVPIANTTTVTVIFPSDAAVSAVCGTLVNGQWGQEVIVNHSNYALTLATTTGSGITFNYATGTPSVATAYPPKIPANTTSWGFPIQTENGLVDFNFILFNGLGSKVIVDPAGSGGGSDPFTHPSATVSATTSQMLLAASTTIGNGTGTGGLTISGQATSTGTYVFPADFFSITNPPVRFKYPDMSSGASSKGGIMEWGGFMPAATYYYGSSTQSYYDVNNSQFTIAGDAYKKWAWITAHYNSPASTGEGIHQHLNFETVQSDWTTVVTRLSISFGEDVARVEFPNSNVHVFNDKYLQIGTETAGLRLMHNTGTSRLEASTTLPFQFASTTGLRIGSVGNPAALVHTDRLTTDSVGIKSQSSIANGSALFLAESGAAGGTAFQTLVTGDSINRFSQNTSGAMQWGTGALTRDTGFSRASAGVLAVGTGASGNTAGGLLMSSSTIVSGLFSANGGASTTLLSVSGNTWLNGKTLNGNGDVFAQSTTIIVSTTTNTGQYTDIQSALNAVPSTGGTVHVRCGTYTLPTASVGANIKTAGTTLEGEGRCTQLNFDQANTATAIGMNVSALSNITVKDLYIHQTNATFGGVGINASNTPLFIAEKIKIDGTATSTWLRDTANQTFYQTWSNLDLRDNTTCVQIGDRSSNPVNDNQFNNIRCAMHSGNNGFALYVDANTTSGAQNNSFNNFESEPTGAATGLTALMLIRAIDTQFNSSYIEGNAVAYNIGSESQRITFNGGEFVSNTTYTNAGSNVQFLNFDREGTAINSFSASTSIVDVTGNDASVPSFSIYGNTSFAKANDLIKLTFANGSDSGAGVHIINPGTGNSIQVDSGKSILMGKVGVGTTTPINFGMMTLTLSTGPQLALSSGATTDPLWTFRNAGGNLYLATSTFSATSTNTAFSIFTNSTPSLAVGTTTGTGILNLGTSQSTNSTSTVYMGKIQYDGYNSAGVHICIFMGATTSWQYINGSCTP